MEYDEPIFNDALFYQKRKHGKYRAVPAPQLGAPGATDMPGASDMPGLTGVPGAPAASIADTHAHVQMLPDPALALAKCMLWGVDFVCDVCDVCEDAERAFANLMVWQAAAPARARELAEATLSLSADGNPVVEQSQAQIRTRIESPGWDAGVRMRIIVGCHPHNAKKFDADAQARLRELLCDPRVCAIGEIGLDYHYDFSPRQVQIEAFRTQIRMAHELGMPISLHIREAHDEALRILDEEGFPQAGTLLHCFNLDGEVLAPWLERGCYVAFGGPLTFKASDYVREAARCVPHDRLLTETDAPYMTPEPMRGMVCGPHHTVFTADVLAQTLGCTTPEERIELFGQLAQNARRLLDREPLAWQKRVSENNG